MMDIFSQTLAPIKEPMAVGWDDQLCQYSLDDIDIYYYPDDNLFTDCDGFEIINPYEYITPQDLKIFWFYKRDMVFQKLRYMVYMHYQSDKGDEPLEYEIYF